MRVTIDLGSLPSNKAQNSFQSSNEKKSTFSSLSVKIDQPAESKRLSRKRTIEDDCLSVNPKKQRTDINNLQSSEQSRDEKSTFFTSTQDQFDEPLESVRLSRKRTIREYEDFSEHTDSKKQCTISEKEQSIIKRKIREIEAENNSVLKTVERCVSNKSGHLDISYRTIRAPLNLQEYSFIIRVSLFSSLIKDIRYLSPPKTLKALSIKKGQIKSTNDLDQLLKNLDNLYQLNLSNNSLSHIPVISFKVITSLDLSHNPLKSIPSELPPLLSYLNLSNTQLHDSMPLQGTSESIALTSILNKLVHLERLYLSENKISDMSHLTLKLLTDFDISNNQLQQVPIQVITNEMINLQLYDNKLTICHIKNSINLQSLDLSHNQITTCYIKNLTNLRWLYLSHNKVCHLSIDENASIQCLDLSHNQMCSAALDRFLPCLQNLKELNLSYNKLVIPPWNFSCTLEELNLDHNDIKFCSHGFLPNNNIKTLNICLNPITLRAYKTLEESLKNKEPSNANHEVSEAFECNRCLIISGGKAGIEADIRNFLPNTKAMSFEQRKFLYDWHFICLRYKNKRKKIVESNKKILSGLPHLSLDQQKFKNLGKKKGKSNNFQITRLLLHSQVQKTMKKRGELLRNLKHFLL